MNNRSFESFREFIGEPAPQVLYHYTNLNGLLGIIENKEIWLSDLYFLNDKNEFELGLNLVAESFEAIRNLSQSKPLFKKFFDEITDAISYIKERSSPFVLSLTSDKDLLSQWRGYTENGVGVNIGLKTSFFELNKMKIYKCIYDPTVQKKFASAIVLKALSTFEERYKTFTEEGRYDDETNFLEAVSVAGGYFIDNTILACCLMKNYGFVEEQEWRAVYINRTQKVHFLPKPNYFKPFVKLEFKDFNKYLDSITTGPNPETELCILSIKKLLESKHISETKIDSSIIPYRN